MWKDLFSVPKSLFYAQNNGQLRFSLFNRKMPLTSTKKKKRDSINYYLQLPELCPIAGLHRLTLMIGIVYFVEFN